MEADFGVRQAVIQERRRKELLDIFDARLEFLSSPLYTAAYALCPECLDHSVSGDERVMADLTEVLERMPADDDQVTVALRAFTDYTSKRFRSDRAERDVKSMPPHIWWEVYGAFAGPLQTVAMKLLAQCPTATPCERNWSSYDFVHSKKRNRLGAERCRKLVFVFQNSRFMTRYRLRDNLEEYERWRIQQCLSEYDMSDDEDSDGDDVVDGDHDDDGDYDSDNERPAYCY